jgi:UDP-N-acetylbacillosamine N-acetyltransferase
MAATERIGIYGTGGHGKVVAQIARACGFDEIVWIDDAAKEGSCAFEAFLKTHSGIPVALGIGENATRQKVYEKVRSAGIRIATLVHPDASIAPDANLGIGTVVMPKAVVNAEAVIGNGVIVNSGAVVEHDCTVGDFAHISPNAALAGAVRVGKRSHIGIGSCVIQRVEIGDDVVVAAGASVVAPLPDGVMAAGVPAVIKKEPK